MTQTRLLVRQFEQAYGEFHRSNWHEPGPCECGEAEYDLACVCGQGLVVDADGSPLPCRCKSVTVRAVCRSCHEPRSVPLR